MGQSAGWQQVELNPDNTVKTVPIEEVVTFQMAPAAGLGPKPIICQLRLRFIRRRNLTFLQAVAYTGPKFAIDAMAAGKEAAESLHRFVWEGTVLWDVERRRLHHLDKDNADLSSYDTMPRQRPRIYKGKYKELQGPPRDFH